MAKFTSLAVLEGVSAVVEAAVRLGLVSGAAVAVAFGQLIFGGFLAALALGMFLRFKRGRIPKSSANQRDE